MISMHFLRRSVKSSSFMALQTDRPIFPIARARVGPGRSKGARRASCRCQATDGRRRQFHLAVVESFSDALAALYFVELNFQWLRFKKKPFIVRAPGTIVEGNAYKGQIIQIALAKVVTHAHGTWSLTHSTLIIRVHNRSDWIIYKGQKE